MNNPIMTLSDRADILERDHSKTELLAMARAKGWKGDPERAYTDMKTGEPVHQSSTDRIQQLKDEYRLATGKTALAYFVAGFAGNPATPEPEPEPTAPQMTAEQSEIIQSMTDKFEELGGSVYMLSLTGDYEKDRAHLKANIAELERSRAAYIATMQSAAGVQTPRRQSTASPAQNNAPQGDKMAQLMALIQEVTQTNDGLTIEQVTAIVDERMKAEAEGLADAMKNHTDGMAKAVSEALSTIKTELMQIAEGNAQPKEIIITTPTGAQTLGGTLHPKFEKVLRLVNAGLNVLLVGGAGSGKTHLAEQIAKALKLEYGCIHGSSGASESQLTGWLLPTGANGTFEYHPAPFVELYEKGNSLFCLDELDAFDPNMLLIANSALSNDYISVPQRLQGNRVNRGERAHILATANTYGTGADMIYSGRNQLDGATLDRFYMVHIDYMTSLEAQVLGQSAKAPKAWTAASDKEEDIKADMAELYQWLNDLRKKTADARLRRVISTRAYQKADKARRALISIEEIKTDLLMGWTADELRKVGVTA